MSKFNVTCDVHPVTGRILETPESRQAGLDALRSKMQITAAGSDIVYPRQDDQFLLAFLRATKYNIDTAHAVATNFARFWYDPKYRDIIEGLSVQRVKSCLRLGYLQFLTPLTDYHGNTLTALYQANMDASTLDCKLQIQGALYFLAYVFENEDIQLQGGTFVQTFEGLSFLAAMGLGKVMSNKEHQDMMAILTEAFPLRLRHVWVIRQPWYFNVFWKLVKPLLSHRITKHVHLLGSNLQELHAAISRDNLPRAFGGTNNEPFDRFVRDLEELETSHGKIGGFAIPFSVDDPTGAVRASAAKTAPVKVAVNTERAAPAVGAGISPRSW